MTKDLESLFEQHFKSHGSEATATQLIAECRRYLGEGHSDENLLDLLRQLQNIYEVKNQPQSGE